MPIPIEHKIKAEQRLRELLDSEGLPQPDAVEYGFTCIRLLYHAAKACFVVDLDEFGELVDDDDDDEPA